MHRNTRLDLYPIAGYTPWHVFWLVRNVFISHRANWRCARMHTNYLIALVENLKDRTDERHVMHSWTNIAEFLR